VVGVRTVQKCSEKKKQKRRWEGENPTDEYGRDGGRAAITLTSLEKQSFPGRTQIRAIQRRNQSTIRNAEKKKCQKKKKGKVGTA